MKDYLTGNSKQNYADIEASNITNAIDDVKYNLSQTTTKETFKIGDYAKYNSHSFDKLVNAQKQE